jgi:hypothetical protein
LTHDPKQVKEIWRSLGVKDDHMKKHWPKWMQHVAYWVRREYPFGDFYFPNKDLLKDVGP